MKRIGRILFFLGIGLFLVISNAAALTPTMEVAIGYDDNPAEIDDVEGSGFTRYRVLLEQTFLKDITGLRGDLHLEADYGQYFRVEDEYQLGAGATLDRLTTFSRKDKSWSTGLSAVYYPVLEVEADFSGHYRKVASSLDFNSYQELGASMRLGWFWSDEKVHLSAEVINTTFEGSRKKTTKKGGVFEHDRPFNIVRSISL